MYVWTNRTTSWQYKNQNKNCLRQTPKKKNISEWPTTETNSSFQINNVHSTELTYPLPFWIFESMIFPNSRWDMFEKTLEGFTTQKTLSWTWWPAPTPIVLCTNWALPSLQANLISPSSHRRIWIHDVFTYSPESKTNGDVFPEPVRFSPG